MATDTYYGVSGNDGYILSTGPTWSTVRGAGSNLVAYSSGQNNITVGDGRENGPNTDYTAREGFLDFDTSGLPDGDTISSAVVSLYHWSSYGNNLTFYLLSNDHSTSITTADWVNGTTVSSKTLYGSVSPTQNEAAQYNNFSDIAMSANVNKTGHTRMMVVTTEFYNNVTPGDWNYQWFAYASSVPAGTTTDPYITVTHAAPAVGRSFAVIIG